MLDTAFVHLLGQARAMLVIVGSNRDNGMMNVIGRKQQRLARQCTAFVQRFRTDAATRACLFGCTMNFGAFCQEKGGQVQSGPCRPES